MLWAPGGEVLREMFWGVCVCVCAVDSWLPDVFRLWEPRVWFASQASLFPFFSAHLFLLYSHLTSFVFCSLFPIHFNLNPVILVEHSAAVVSSVTSDFLFIFKSGLSTRSTHSLSLVTRTRNIVNHTWCLLCVFWLGTNGGYREEPVDHRLTDREWADEWRHLDHVSQLKQTLGRCWQVVIKTGFQNVKIPWTFRWSLRRGY